MRKFQNILIALVFVASPFLQPAHSGSGEVERIGIKYNDFESEEFLIKVLTKMNLEFSVEAENGEVIIYWKSESKYQQQEIMNRVSQYNFIKDVCKELPLPSPDQPAKNELSC